MKPRSDEIAYTFIKQAAAYLDKTLLLIKDAEFIQKNYAMSLACNLSGMNENLINAIQVKNWLGCQKIIETMAEIYNDLSELQFKYNLGRR
jgi:ferritin-like protein